MGLVRYIGPFRAVTIAGANASCAHGATVTVTDEIAASLLMDPESWEAGDEHTAGLTPYSVAPLQPVIGYAKEVYEPGRLYSAGVLVPEGGAIYLSLKQTEGEAPASHPLAWKVFGGGGAGGNSPFFSAETLAEVEALAASNLAPGTEYTYAIGAGGVLLDIERGTA